MKIFEEQPKEYNRPEELIDWFIWDLYQQRLEIANKKNIIFDNSKSHDEINHFLSQKICKSELILNMGNYELDLGYFTYVHFSFDITCFLRYMDNMELDSRFFHIEMYTIKYALNCCNVHFSNDVNFSGSIFINEVSFHDTHFYSDVEFLCSIFTKPIIIDRCEFDRFTNFQCSLLNARLDIAESIFNDKLDFSGSIFNNVTEFYESTFNKIIFDFIYLYHKIIFRSMNYNNNSSILFLNINSEMIEKKGALYITNTVINGYVEFNKVSINEINLDSAFVIGGGVFNTNNLKVENYYSWKTAEFLKHEAIKLDKLVEALKYKAIEKQLYTKELLERKDKSIQEWGECFLLLISKLSNNHGQSWLQAVFFTLGCAFYFLTLSIATGVFDYVPSLDMSDFITNYFQYLLPTNFDLLQCADKSNNITLILFNVFYIFGKVAISYGIVEIVQAFRKFNTKGN